MAMTEEKIVIQEMRKEVETVVEREFGTFFLRFRLVKEQFFLRYLEDMIIVMKSGIIIQKENVLASVIVYSGRYGRRNMSKKRERCKKMVRHSKLSEKQ